MNTAIRQQMSQEINGLFFPRTEKSAAGFRFCSFLSFHLCCGGDTPFFDLNPDSVFTGFKGYGIFRNLHKLAGHAADGRNLVT